MILIWLFDTCTGFRFTKNVKDLDLQVHQDLLGQPQDILGEIKNISFIHYYFEFGGNMGTKRSEILHESQFLEFGALFFSQNWVNFKKH